MSDVPETEYCYECKCLRPKEYEQSDKKEPHWCSKYGKPVFHNGHHPELPKLEECIDDEADSVNYDDYRDQNPKEMPRE